MGISEKIANAKNSNWLCEGFTEAEIKHIIKSSIVRGDVMKVCELIEKLKEMPQDAVVVASHCYEDYSIEKVDFKENDEIVDGNKSYVLIR